ncbi:hypothetical protein Afil01_65280 [Actinorhabdospora filicis]|uniref:WD40 repeat domain-containing protein n=1 Tax=Actinorhabdospora filicis TaxID=1785913 RepID=A0A9W6SSM3_9ACTN|nr:hypothetical protein [Actinorhabdospora filicis]GLZ81721.1 hypothetical protein Afil01_65280 [Actinorhabdospora filicis]
MPKPVIVALLPHASLDHRAGRVTWRADGRRFFTSTAALLAGDAPAFEIAPPWPDRHVHDVALSPAGDRVAVAGTHALRVTSTSGEPLWELPHACWARCGERHASADYADDSRHRYPDGGSAAFSPDGALLWAHVRADGGEEWLVLDAATGDVLARHALDTYAHGSHHLSLPDGSMLLCVGEGQDGVPVYFGAYRDGLVAREVSVDRVPLDVSPSGTLVMTVAHYEESLSVHRPGEAEPLMECLAEDHFPSGGEDRAQWRYVGGFLSEDTVISSGNEDDVELGPDRHRLVDTESGAVTEVAYDREVTGRPVPLGDGLWATGVAAGTAVWRLD